MSELRIGELFEVIVYAQDMARMVEFYHRTLGLPIAWPAGLDDYSAEHWVALAPSGCTLALHSGGSGSAAAPRGKADADTGEGAGATYTPPRFGFRVDDIHAVRAELIARGVECGEVRSPAPGVLVCDLRDPEGNGLFVEQRD